MLCTPKLLAHIQHMEFSPLLDLLIYSCWTQVTTCKTLFLPVAQNGSQVHSDKCPETGEWHGEQLLRFTTGLGGNQRGGKNDGETKGKRKSALINSLEVMNLRANQTCFKIPSKEEKKCYSCSGADQVRNQNLQYLITWIFNKTYCKADRILFLKI